MKFSVSSSDLLKHLQIASGAIGSNPVLPILEDFLFTIEGRNLTISATDLETSIITTVDVNSDGNGRVAVPARILLDTLKELPGQPVTFNVNEENFGIEITSAYGKYKLAGENGDEFPNIPQAEEVDTVTLNSGLLGEGTKKRKAAEIHEMVDFYGGTLSVPVNLDTSNIVLILQ